MAVFDLSYSLVSMRVSHVLPVCVGCKTGPSGQFAAQVEVRMAVGAPVLVLTSCPGCNKPRNYINDPVTLSLIRSFPLSKTRRTRLSPDVL